MKKLLLSLTSVFSTLLALAAHITGGEMYYTLVSENGNNYTYEVTLKLYRDCNSTGADLDASAAIAIFNNGTNASVWSQLVPLTTRITQNLSSPGPCIQNPPIVCYQTGFYTFRVTLPATAQGYTIAYQRCCRIAGINNIINSSGAGATYSATIPGTAALATAPNNNSANFIGVDTVITCANNAFCYNFGATDIDGDSLVYGFDYAYVGGSQQTPAPSPPQAPPYNSVTYSGDFSENSPLGSGVTIDPRTGMMCGVAPAPGIYVVTVSVREYRQGKLIATQRKDLQIKVGDCNVAKAAPAIFDINGMKVQPGVAGCKSFTYSFANDVPPNPLIRTYYWEFSDGATYTTANPSHTFRDTGEYTIKLVINRGEDCGDSVTTKLKIYPGFFPGFTYTGVCVNKTTQFTDTTRTIYGSVNSWKWDFGENSSTADVSQAQNPTYSYPAAGVKNVIFIVTNSVGCLDTVRKSIDILTKPPMSVAFKDTLICNGDSLQLQATGNGLFSWTPLTRINNANTPNPVVFPTTTTNYIVQLDDQGCLANDTVKVRVVDFVTLQAMADTTICATDTLRLSASTNGLRYTWNNATTLNNPNVLQPIAKPISNPTTYTITSVIGGCSAQDDVVVTMVPYPVANAGNDTAICYNTAAQLNGTMDGTSHTWTPTNTLANAATLTPTATPKTTTAYILSAFDTRGCPKPGRDTVIVAVNPEVVAFAGRDTAVVVGQTLQFHATGGESYQWSPPTNLSGTTIPDPKAVYSGDFDSIRYSLVVADSIGCTDDATVLVKIFRTNPRVFVPTAFTPNGDGRNDFVAPIAVGLTKLEYFRIYNRWGQLVFETTMSGKGWDGRISGKEQASSSYVWIVKGTDFTGKVVFEKGTVTLIR